GYTLIFKGTQIQYRETEPLGEGNPILQSLHSNIQRDTDKIQGEGTIGRRESCPAEDQRYNRGEEEREPLGEGNPALQSLHSNIQKDTDTMQGEGTIGRKESYPAELAL
ncbi:hypothetical protein XELAEV_18000737mg, partial [Xenopus laevis]